MAGFYIACRNAILNASSDHTIIRPNLYTQIFISCDVVSATLQAVGGGVASASNTDTHVSASTFNTVLLVGMCIQLVTLLVFAAVAVLSARKVVPSSASTELMQNSRFRKFVCAMAAAYLAILVRTIYRVAAASGGWKNGISRNEAAFMVLEGL
jgi:hypothetical protein